MTLYSIRNTDQPNPVSNDLPWITELVTKDLQERLDMGIEKYGIPLQPQNGRDPLLDLYQELMDGCLYIRQLIFEKYGE